MARATSSRGLSSSTKRSPSASRSVAPSPRIASVMRKPLMPWAVRPPSSSGPPATTAVGWNWTSSRSARAAPALRASRSPLPNEPGGLVVRRQRAAVPPVARMVARAWMAAPSSVTRPMTRPSWTQSAAALRRSRTSMSGSRATRAESSLVIRRPVALPPAWATRRAEWPPSRPRARLPSRSASKWTPRDSRSRRALGASSVSTRGGAGPDGAAAGLDRVVEVALRRVVGGGGGGEPALGPVGGGLGERRRRDEHGAGTGAGGGQRRVQPGRPGAHDDEVGVRQAAQG